MALQAQAKKIVRQFNALPPEDMDGRAALLPKLFGEVGREKCLDCAAAYGCGW